MNNKVGNVSFYGMQQDQFSKPYSDDTATLIDDEVRILLEKEYQRAQELLRKYEKELHILAKSLLEREVLVKSDVSELIGERPWPAPETISEAIQEAKNQSDAAAEIVDGVETS